MEPTQFFAASQVFIVAGKGGVGKTVVSAALARAAVAAGRRTLVLGVERRGSLSRLFDAIAWDYHPHALGSDLFGAELSPDAALVDYLNDHGLNRIAKHLSSSGLVEVIASTTPGIKDLLVLGKIKQHEQAAAFETIVVDAPAAGHAVAFLDAARALHDLVKVGPIHTQAVDVLEMLRTPERAQVVLVTLPEETPVNELIETAFRLEDRVGVTLGPVVVNGLWPDVPGLARDPGRSARGASAGELADLRAAAAFWRAQVEQQGEQIERLAERLPLPQLHLPYLFKARVDPGDIAGLATTLTAELTAKMGAR